MTRNMIFAGVLGGAVVLVGISALLSSDGDDDNWRYEYTDEDYVEGSELMADGELKIGSRGDSIVVETEEGTINCTKNGGKVVITRKDGDTVEIYCD